MLKNFSSDSIESFVSECPINPDEENVLFCFYLSTKEWEKVYSFVLYLSCLVLSSLLMKVE